MKEMKFTFKIYLFNIKSTTNLNQQAFSDKRTFSDFNFLKLNKSICKLLLRHLIYQTLKE